MSLETQLEFPFLNEIRMKLYAEKQKQYMYSLYNLSYKYDGDYGSIMKFGDFVQDIWIRGGMAKTFHDTHYSKYFYDQTNTS